MESSLTEGTDLPHNLPMPEVFNAGQSSTGYNANSKIFMIITVLCACRSAHMVECQPWATLTIAVLDGGLPKWISAGLPTVAKSSSDTPISNFTAQLNTELVADADWIMQNLQSNAAINKQQLQGRRLA